MKAGRTTFPELAARHHRRLHELAAGDGRKALAASVILLLHEGWEPRAVARESGLTRTRVTAIRQRFLLLGLAGLHDPEPSAPRAAARKAARQTTGAMPSSGSPDRQPAVLEPEKREEAASAPALEPALAEEAENLLQFSLAPEHRRRVQVVLDATNPRLTLAEVARRAGVAPSTVSRWWATARREGLVRLLVPETASDVLAAAPRLDAVA